MLDVSEKKLTAQNCPCIVYIRKFKYRHLSFVFIENLHKIPYKKSTSRGTRANIKKIHSSIELCVSITNKEINKNHLYISIM